MLLEADRRNCVREVLVIVAALYGSIQLLGTVKTEFFPLGDRNQILVYIDLEAGADQRETAGELRHWPDMPVAHLFCSED